jgi:alkanesulfonate monooxygenase SsuD/methylene tetrahydromethanopterin reductase-like flavin-dependent oxidoreductase (luciferase family)
MTRYAVGLPNVGEFGDPGVLVELAVLAEEHGWDGVYLWDHLLFHDPTWPVANPTVVAAAMAAATSRVRLIVVHVLPRRRAQLVAREAATLDHLSGGRLTLVATIGSMNLEYEGFGESADLRARGAALDAALDDVCALWTGEPVTVVGGTEPVRMVPTPVQRPRIPIWCGGRWPNRPPLRRAARFDGVMPTFVDQISRVVPPDELAAAVAVVTAARGGAPVGFDAGPTRPRRKGAGSASVGFDSGFDVVMEGAMQPGQAAAELIESYARVGLTWWIEAMGWWRAEPAHAVAAARQRIAAGPPTP